MTDTFTPPFVSVLEQIRERWSPRAFADRAVEREKLLSLFEAARWAPSSFNEQPWRFILGVRGEGETHDRLIDTMVDFNRRWASSAPVLLLAVTKVTYSHDGRNNRHHFHDVGMALENLAIQATALDLRVHYMGGFSATRAREIFSVPGDFEPATMAAIGYEGAPDTLPEDLRKEEEAPRTRKSLQEILFHDRFGKAYPID